MTPQALLLCLVAQAAAEDTRVADDPVADLEDDHDTRGGAAPDDTRVSDEDGLADRPLRSLISGGPRLGVDAAFVLLPMAGPTAGATVRVRFTDLVALEPHVDGVLDTLILLGFLQGQAGVPVVFYVPASDARFVQHVGLGPLAGYGTLVGHIEKPEPIVMVGGEGVFGADWQITEGLEGRFQCRIWAMSMVPQPFPVVGLSATVGVLFGAP